MNAIFKKIEHFQRTRIRKPLGIFFRKVRIETEILFGQVILKKPNRDPGSRIIVSLTTFPERIHEVELVLYTLMRQEYSPDEIILNLSSVEFPEREKELPGNLNRLIKSGIKICWVKDIKSYKKLLPTLKNYPNEIIVTADDDVYYPPDWLGKLVESHRRNPEGTHCHRANRIRFTSDGQIELYKNWETARVGGEKSIYYLPTGMGGILYPPDLFDEKVFDENIFMKDAPDADDLWFWVHTILSGNTSRIVDEPILQFEYINERRVMGKVDGTVLWHTNVKNGGNDRQLANLLKRYPVIKEKIVFRSAGYWDERYRKLGNSGGGSYGRLADFKAQILNKFVKEYGINSVIEFGSGDGNQLSLSEYPEYLGVDVSPTAIANCRVKFSGDSSKSFYLLQDSNDLHADLALSLDVIYHLMEDDIFHDYMNRLFNASKIFVIIYSSDKEEYYMEHIRHRQFSEWIIKNKKEWKLIEYLKNPYPFEQGNPDTSFADFFIYRKH